MIRNLKVLGLALVAICAMSAMLASAASADFTAKAGAIITGDQPAGTTQKFTVTDQTVTCEEVKFEGTASADTFAHVTISPRYTKCKTNIGTSVTVTGFGHLAAEAGKPKCGYTISTTGTAALECETGAEVTVDAGPCVVHIPAQHFASGVTFTTGVKDGVHDLLLHFDIKGITGNHTDGFLCPFGSSGHNAEAVLEGTSTATAHLDGVPVDLTKHPFP